MFALAYQLSAPLSIHASVSCLNSSKPFSSHLIMQQLKVLAQQVRVEVSEKKKKK